jgi:hypothetical protein
LGIPIADTCFTANHVRAVRRRRRFVPRGHAADLVTDHRPEFGLNSTYDLHPDERRVAFVAAETQASAVQDKVVFGNNFLDYLRKIAPGRK